MARTSERLVVVLSERLASTTDRAIRTVVRHRGPAIAAAGDALPAELRGRRPDALSASVSGRLALQVPGRLARRRAHIILGREIPLLGIGLAAGYNLRSTRGLGNETIRFLRHIA